jgi:MacB-like periplasmic core domain
MWTDVTIGGKPHVGSWTNNELCTVDYFRTLGLEWLRGQLLNQQDLDSVRYVTVVNETLARQYFGKEDLLGQKIKFEVFDRLSRS